MELFHARERLNEAQRDIVEAKDRSHAAIINRGPRTRIWMTACLLVLAGFLIWKAYHVILLVLAAALVAIMVGGLARWLCEHSRFSYRVTLTVVVLLLFGLLIGTGFILVPRLAAQTSQLQTDLPRALQQLQQQVGKYEIGRQLLDYLNSFGVQMNAKEALPKAAMALSTVLTIIGGVLVLIFVSLYLAADPCRYINGVVRLFAPHKRQRAKEVIHVLGHTLQRWLVGRLILMVLNAVVTTIGLWALQIPLALSLGILSGLLQFVPNFGPIIAAIPAILIAFLEGPDKALYVLILYIVYQNIDGYILEPQVEKRTISLPPAITILAQVLLGILFGTMGVLLAAPIAGIALVLVKMLYLEDVFGERVELHTGEESS